MLALSLNVLTAAASAPVWTGARCLLVRSSDKQPDFRFANNVCFSEDRSNPAYRYTASPHIQSPTGALVRMFGALTGLFFSRSEARSGLIRFFGFNLVACPSRVFPSRLFFSFSCAVLLDLVCARRSYIHRLLLLLLLAGRPLLVTWCAAMVSLPPAGFSAVAV